MDRINHSTTEITIAVVSDAYDQRLLRFEGDISSTTSLLGIGELSKIMLVQVLNCF